MNSVVFTLALICFSISFFAKAQTYYPYEQTVEESFNSSTIFDKEHVITLVRCEAVLTWLKHEYEKIEPLTSKKVNEDIQKLRHYAELSLIQIKLISNKSNVVMVSDESKASLVKDVQHELRLMFNEQKSVHENMIKTLQSSIDKGIIVGVEVAEKSQGDTRQCIKASKVHMLMNRDIEDIFDAVTAIK